MKQIQLPVCIRCVTYNHASYIEDAMDGFVIQQTKFPFVCAIIDDASTDGEQDVIKKYLEANFNLDDKESVRKEDTKDYVLTFAQHKTNSNCYFAIILLKYNHHSIKKSKVSYLEEWIDNAKYVAYCEGDDYWINPQKLQKQVEVMDSHPECAISYCKIQMVNKYRDVLENKTIPLNGHIKAGIVTIEDYCKEEFYNGHWCFHTSSYLLRGEFARHTEERRLFFSQFPYGDMPIQLWCLIHGNGYYLDNTVGCYRTLSGGYNSYVSTHPEFAISQGKRLMKALFFLDDYTSGNYHKYINRHILRTELNIKIKEGKKLSIYKPRYWTFLNDMNIFGHIATIMSALCPSLYSHLLKRHE